jgi:ribonuclease VapC
MFCDASAIVAVILGERDHEHLVHKMNTAEKLFASPLSVYESVLAIGRFQNGGPSEAKKDVDFFLASGGIVILDIDEAIGAQALLAFDRFGKGRHKASLNMGDCFAYACAKVHKLPLLCKGDDFIHTDIRLA